MQHERDPLGGGQPVQHDEHRSADRVDERYLLLRVTRLHLGIEAGIADAVSFGKLFIANPDLVSRFARGHGLAASDRSTHYSGGAHGYVDYPIWSP